MPLVIQTSAIELSDVGGKSPRANASAPAPSCSNCNNLQSRIRELESEVAALKKQLAWRMALEQCQEIIELLKELPERTPDEFRDDIGIKAESMSIWIEENQHVTPEQQRALDNMQGGVERWLN